MHRLSLCLRSVLILTLLFSPFIWAQNPALEKAILAYEQRDYDKAEKLLLPLTHQGNAEANFYLGQIYRLGHLGEEDPARALEYYQVAAEKGYTLAQRHLGALHYYGVLGEENYQQAHYWLEKSALSDDAWSQWLLALAHLNGQGVEKNAFKAYQWASLAEQKGHLESLNLKNAIKRQLSMADLHKAEQLDMMLSTREKNGSSPALSEKTPHSPQFSVQLGAFREKARAQRYFETLSARNFESFNNQQPRVYPSRGIFKVIVGEYDSLDTALSACKTIKNGTLDCFVTRLD